jgi:hypothetical protein
VSVCAREVCVGASPGGKNWAAGAGPQPVIRNYGLYNGPVFMHLVGMNSMGFPPIICACASVHVWYVFYCFCSVRLRSSGTLVSWPRGRYTVVYFQQLLRNNAMPVKRSVKTQDIYPESFKACSHHFHPTTPSFFLPPCHPFPSESHAAPTPGCA